MCIIVIQTKYRGVEQLVARRAHNPEVAGSSPVPATKAPRTISSWGLLLTYYLFTLTSNVLGALEVISKK